MKLLEKKINEYTTEYYTLDGVLKYEYYKTSYDYECWTEYDINGNAIYCKDSSGYESWAEYDKNGNEIHYKNADGYEWWREYDNDGNEIYYKNSKGVIIGNRNKQEKLPEVDIEPFTFNKK